MLLLLIMLLFVVVVVNTCVLSGADTRGRGVRGKRVLELGSGTGALGMFSSLLGASHVMLTDMAMVLDLLQRNIQHNNMSDNVKAMELSWGTQQSQRHHQEYDVILCADLLFTSVDRDWYRPLAETLIQFCCNKQHHVVVYFAFQERGSGDDDDYAVNLITCEPFFNMLRESGLQSEQVTYFLLLLMLFVLMMMMMMLCR